MEEGGKNIGGFGLRESGGGGGVPEGWMVLVLMGLTGWEDVVIGEGGAESPIRLRVEGREGRGSAAT